MAPSVQKKRFLLSHAVGLLFLFLFALFPTRALASLDIPDSFVLPNGLRVIVKRDSSSPLVALQAWVETGSADEVPEEAGLAHLVEHILFRGSSEAGTGKLAGELESLGGRMNGFTSRDHTVYHMVLPAPGFNEGLKILSQMMQLPSLSESDLRKEIRVVLEEWKQGEDNPRSRASSALFRTVYQIHAYGRPIIGSPETLRRMTWENVSHFYHRWYSANNMILVLVGDIDKEKIKTNIHDLFGKFPSRELAVRYYPEEPLQEQPRLQILRTSFRQPRLMIGFPIPAAIEEDAPALDILSFVLGRGESSRLAKSLKMATGLVHSISASAFSSKRSGLFSIEAQLETEKITEALKAILKEIYLLRDELAGSSELERARVNFARAFIEARETVQGQANQMGRFLSVFGDSNYEEAYMEQIRRVGSEKIRSAARTFLKTEKLSVVLLVPEGATPLPDIEQIVALSRSAESPRAALSGQDQAGIFRTTLENGLRIFIREDHRLPTFSIHVGLSAGLLLENETNNGIHNLIAAMLTQGTPTLSATQLVDQVEHLGGRLNGSAGNGMLSVIGTFPSSKAERGLEILFDVLLYPTFPETELEKKRKEILTQIRNQDERISSQAFRLFYQKLLRQHPYRLDPLGQRDRVERFRREDLIAHYQKTVSPERMVVSVVGDVDKEKILSMLQARLSPLQKKSESFSPPLAEEGANEIRIEKTTSRSKQAHLVLGFSAPTRAQPEYFAMKVLQTVLSGIGGRLFVDLRDKQGLAYSVNAFSLDDRYQGAFGIYAATDPSAVDKMKEGILAEIRRVQDEEVSPAELDRAKKSIIGNYRIGLQTNVSKAAALTYNEISGLGTDFARRYQEGVEKVTAADILRFARAYLPLDRYVLAIVGPQP